MDEDSHCEGFLKVYFARVEIREEAITSITWTRRESVLKVYVSVYIYVYVCGFFLCVFIFVSECRERSITTYAPGNTMLRSCIFGCLSQFVGAVDDIELSIEAVEMLFFIVRELVLLGQ